MNERKAREPLRVGLSRLLVPEDLRLKERVRSAYEQYLRQPDDQKEGTCQKTKPWAQIITTITTVFYAGVFAIGYSLLIKRNQLTLKEMREQRISGGRPQVILQARYDRLPMVDLVVRNFGGGVAKEITFASSCPIEDSTGFVLSELPYLKEGMSFLGPGEEAACVWDDLENLLSSLRDKGHKRGILVKVRCEDLAGESYESEWRMNPLIYENKRHVPSHNHQAL